MTRILLWDDCPGELRSALVENGDLTEFRIFRRSFRGPPLAPGTLFTARIVETTGKGKARVALGAGQEALLEQTRKLPEGTLLTVEIDRPAIPEPGRWKLPWVKPRDDVAPLADLGCHFPQRAAWEDHLLAVRDKVDQILCVDAMAAGQLTNFLGGDSPTIGIDRSRIEEADFDSLAEAAVTGEFAIEGGMLTIERTRAMTTIDVDGGGDPMRLNHAAAAEIPRLMRLLDIGAQIGIDFLAMPDRIARQALDASLAAACSVLGPHERTAANGFGFVQIVRPRPRPSVPEILCGTNRAQMSMETQAIALLRQTARSIGHGTRQLVAKPAIIDLLREWRDELDTLQKRLGAAIELVPDSGANGYGHVHVSQS